MAAVLDCLVARKRFDFIFGITELGQELAGVGAERRRRRRRARDRRSQPEAGAHHAHVSSTCGTSSNVCSNSRVDDLRMLQHGGHVEHLAGRNATAHSSAPTIRPPGAPPAPARSRFSSNDGACDPRGRQSADRWQAPAARSASHSASNCCCWLAAMLSRPSPVRNVPDGARGHVLVAERLRPHARDQPVGNHPAHRDKRRLQHRHVDELALAGALAAKQRGADRVGRGDAAHRVGDRIADAQRRRLRRRR